MSGPRTRPSETKTEHDNSRDYLDNDTATNETTSDNGQQHEGIQPNRRRNERKPETMAERSAERIHSNGDRHG